MDSFKPSNNPLSLFIHPETTEVSLDKIITGNFEKDDIFHKKYCEYLNGRLKAYITRVSISRIKSGFYRRKEGRWEHVVDDVSKNHINALIAIIKGGYRPPLYLYRNLNQECNFDFICADDVLIYEAYKKLQIKKPPAIILGSKQGIEESAFVMKCLKDREGKPKQFIIAAENINKNSFFSLLGNDISNDIVAELKKLENYLDLLKLEFRDFHSKQNSKVSYHQIMFSIICRSEEMLRSIRILIEQDLHIQASNILRSLYELALTFYMYWLSPHEITQFAQLSSVMSENDYKKTIESKDMNFTKDIKKAWLYQFQFVRSVLDKARLSPFGESYYRDVYAFLSDIAHHDLSMAARYKHSLEHGNDAVYDQDIKDSIIRIADFCIAKIFTRIAADIGSKLD